jgi:hypothetical protein
VPCVVADNVPIGIDEFATLPVQLRLARGGGVAICGAAGAALPSAAGAGGSTQSATAPVGQIIIDTKGTSANSPRMAGSLPLRPKRSAAGLVPAPAGAIGRGGPRRLPNRKPASYPCCLRISDKDRGPMQVNKPHLEFHRLDMTSGWSTPPGYPSGIEQKILAGALDEEGRSGNRTRLLRFAPGVFTTAPFVHEYWEEVYLMEGDLTVGNDAEGRGGESFAAGTYACRPPGAVHGPFKSNRGCLLLEIHYYEEA